MGEAVLHAHLVQELQTLVDRAIAKRIFGACGDVLVLKESYFDLVTAVSGSGPAYFFLLMELLEKEGVRYGLKRSEARRLVIQTAWGSVRLVKETLPSPEVLRKMVTSKGGTTEAAMKVFNKLGSEKIVQQALRRAMKRAKELSR